MTRSVRAMATIILGVLVACGEVPSSPPIDATDAPQPDAPNDAPIDTAIDATPTFTVTVVTQGDGTGTVTSTPAGINCGLDCDEAFAQGAGVTLTAAPAAGTTFLGWSGAGCTGTGSCVIAVTADVTVTAMFALNQSIVVTLAGNGDGAVASAPAGIDCGADCSESFPSGTMVTLTATAATGSSFTGWGGACTGTGTCVVTANMAIGVIATFTLNQHTLTVTRAGNGTGTVTSAPAGINCGSDCTEVYNFGTNVGFTATPAAGSVFTGWSGACTGTGTCSVVMTSNRTVTANFALVQHTLTVARAGTGTGTVTSSPAGINCGSDCTEAYNFGTMVTLTAAASTGSTFAGWSGGGCTGTGTCTVAMNAAQTVTATFTLNQYTLTATRAGTGTGTVASSPAGISCGSDCTENYNHGTVVVLTATPAGTSTFTGWSGAGCSGTGTCTVTMTAATTVTATFAAAPTNCDSFTSADGTTVPNWTERGGDWSITGGRLHQNANGGVYTNVITMNGSTQTDGCVRFTAFHNGTGSVQAVGGVLRWTGPNTYVVALIQDNTSAGNYNNVYFYQYPAGGDIGGSVSGQAFGTNPNVEACVTGNVVRLRVDAARDGTYEFTYQTTTTLAGAGQSGVMTHSFQTATTNHTHVDNFCWGP